MKKALPVKTEKSLKLAKQARGTLDAVIAMIEGDTYCPEVIQQADSVIGLLQSLEKELLANHLNTCVKGSRKDDGEKTIHELLKIYRLSH